MVNSTRRKGILLSWLFFAFLTHAFRANAHECIRRISFSVTTASAEESGNELKLMAGYYFEHKRDALYLFNATFKVEGTILSPSERPLVNASVTMDTMDVSGGIDAVQHVLGPGDTVENRNVRINLDICTSGSANPAMHRDNDTIVNRLLPYFYMLTFWGMLYWAFYWHKRNSLWQLNAFLFLIYPVSVALQWGWHLAAPVFMDQQPLTPLGPYVWVTMGMGFLYFFSQLTRSYLDEMQLYAHKLNNYLGPWGPVVWLLEIIYTIGETAERVMRMFNGH
jgi:hypothetical protein